MVKEGDISQFCYDLYRNTPSLFSTIPIPPGTTVLQQIPKKTKFISILAYASYSVVENCSLSQPDRDDLSVLCVSFISQFGVVALSHGYVKTSAVATWIQKTKSNRLAVIHGNCAYSTAKQISNK